MKTKMLSLSLLAACTLVTPLLHAGTPEQEKAFVDKYKAAYEAGDKATLESFLYTKGANPMALEFYKMMQTEGAGGKITKIDLVDRTPEAVQQESEVQSWRE